MQQHFTIHRTFLIIIQILIPSILFSQALADKISKDVCDCLDKQNDSTIAASFLPCYKNSTSKFQNEIMEGVDFNSDITPGELGRMIGKELVIKVSEDLIYTCNDYYEWLERMKLKIFHIANMDSINHEIIKLSQKLKYNPNDESSLITRGYDYLKLKDFKNAQRDFKRVLKISPTNVISLIYLGLTYEYSGDLKKAIDSYSKASDMTDRQELLIYKIIAMRKI